MRKLENALYVALFLLLCSMPVALLLCGYENPNYERRTLAVRPAKLSTAYPARFDAWLRDHFALRDILVTGCNSLSMAALGDAVNKDVVAGKEGWLFFAPTLGDHTRTGVMDTAAVRRAAKSLQMMRDYAAANGAGFVFTVAPNKNSIYPEMMPDYIQSAGGGKNAALLYAALEEAGVAYVDLEAALLREKGGERLYYSNDTHWNERGARTAYRALMPAIAGGESYDGYENASFTVEQGYSGDIHYFVRPALVGTEEAPRLDAARPFTSEKPFDAERDMLIRTASDTNGLALLMYRDSFAVGLIPYISANAGRAVYSLAFPYDLALIREEAPSVVLVERVERNIPDLATTTPRLTPEATLPAQAPSPGLGAAAILHKEGRRVKVLGRFASGSYDPLRDRVLISVDDRVWYEAFPVMEAEADGLIQASPGTTWGFGLYLPEGTEAKTLRVCVETPGGCVSSPPLALQGL